MTTTFLLSPTFYGPVAGRHGTVADIYALTTGTPMPNVHPDVLDLIEEKRKRKQAERFAAVQALGKGSQPTVLVGKVPNRNRPLGASTTENVAEVSPPSQIVPDKESVSKNSFLQLFSSPPRSPSAMSPPPSSPSVSFVPFQPLEPYFVLSLPPARPLTLVKSLPSDVPLDVNDVDYRLSHYHDDDLPEDWMEPTWWEEVSSEENFGYDKLVTNEQVLSLPLTHRFYTPPPLSQIYSFDTMISLSTEADDNYTSISDPRTTFSFTCESIAPDVNDMPDATLEALLEARSDWEHRFLGLGMARESLGWIYEVEVDVIEDPKASFERMCWEELEEDVVVKEKIRAGELLRL
ncbi:hypothetical protein JAAARDRAFT_48306 [Jaapia argillacea MUCL 33604]|uniref:Uncharacterized protein n=1 Tax=Jaapia argillacea MUCL 33604 TaxID=933084 RepID=A0A067PNR0_9AGAM|nr:hypothetical protein JAAARDRAFT_48306 [Jaapia argillacea MUCL 33604]